MWSKWSDESSDRGALIARILRLVTRDSGDFFRNSPGQLRRRGAWSHGVRHPPLELWQACLRNPAITAGMAPFVQQGSFEPKGLQPALPVGPKWHIAVQCAIDRRDDVVAVARQPAGNRQAV